MQDDDAFNLERFVRAQAPTYQQALLELRAGEKRSHWMWFVFPQLRGLGLSSMAQFYGIETLDEARAYAAHAVLRPRLLACTEAVLAVEGRSLRAILGSPDDRKFQSSMTLFREAAPDEPLFRQALDRLCGGRPDERTLSLLSTPTT